MLDRGFYKGQLMNWTTSLSTVLMCVIRKCRVMVIKVSWCNCSYSYMSTPLNVYIYNDLQKRIKFIRNAQYSHTTQTLFTILVEWRYTEPRCAQPSPENSWGTALKISQEIITAWQQSKNFGHLVVHWTWAFGIARLCSEELSSQTLRSDWQNEI